MAFDWFHFKEHNLSHTTIVSSDSIKWMRPVCESRFTDAEILPDAEHDCPGTGLGPPLSGGPPSLAIVRQTTVLQLDGPTGSTRLPSTPSPKGRPVRSEGKEGRTLHRTRPISWTDDQGWTRVRSWHLRDWCGQRQCCWPVWTYGEWTTYGKHVDDQCMIRFMKFALKLSTALDISLRTYLRTCP